MMNLEKISDKNTTVDADTKVLQNAASYNVDLNALEALGNEVSAKVVNAKIKPEEEAPVRLEWQNMDVNLGDIIERVFEISFRPFIIVSDDKVLYMNPTALKMLEVISLKEVVGEKLLRFVDKKHWSMLAQNIGEMVTEGKPLEINLKSESNKICPTTLHAIYLPDSNHFAFILMGSSLDVVSENSAPPETQEIKGLYDELTGLPNFYLFEDRVQVAINNENYKDVRLQKNLIALVGINIDNWEDFKKMGIQDFALKKLSTTLLLSMKKTYTVGRGLRYPFWVLMTDVANEAALEIELAKIKAVFEDGVTDNFTTHEVSVSMGVSIFPDPARSAKKLIEQGLEAVKKSCEKKGNSLMIYSGK